MKKTLYKLYISFMLIAFMITSCSPDEYSLGGKDYTPDDLVEGLAFTISHDSNNPNIVYLKSLLPSKYTVLWEHPQGRSQSNEVTLKIPFAGEYSVKFGVETKGGIVYGNPATFKVDGFCAQFVNDELWTKLTGGVGKSKKWVLDIDGEGTCRYFVGPLYFYGTADCWDNVTAGKSLPDGSDSWNWNADWAGNGGWLFGSTGAMDYGSMTFDLIDGANVTVEDKYNNKTTKGSFLIDTDSHVMNITDAGVLHDPGRDAIVTQWGYAKILSLTDNYMQLAVLRDNDPNEGKCLLCYNFISQDYKDSWTPASNDNASPSLPDGWQDDVSQITNHKMVWKLSANSPFDWCDLYGKRKNGFKQLSDYSEFNVPAGDVADLTLTMDSKSKKYKLELPNMKSVEGSYTLSSDGIYTFDKGLLNYLIGGDWIKFSADADNQLRVMSFEKNTSGVVNDLWLGAKELNGDGKLYQYLAYHFVAQLDAPTEVTYTSKLNVFDPDFNFTSSDEVSISKDGNYTFTVNGSMSNTYGIYLDVVYLLKDHPNATLTLNSVKVDGNEVSFDPTLVDYCTGDEKDGDGNALTSRIYILNPWNIKAFQASSMVFSKSIVVNISVAFND